MNLIPMREAGWPKLALMTNSRQLAERGVEKQVCSPPVDRLFLTRVGERKKTGGGSGRHGRYRLLQSSGACPDFG